MNDKCCFDADTDPTFHFYADPAPDSDLNSYYFIKNPKKLLHSFYFEKDEPLLP